ncbi:MAG TPA: methyl-accepting chemotaxis protein [Ktedonobacteraceae bacterium]|nr:methyl-accepting chemotaxis protein [Ktedonobacteraceae bacterium]
MTQQKRPTTPIPVRVHFRSPSEQEHAHADGHTNGHNHSAYVAGTQLAADARQMQQRTRQIKELIRLGNMLRADLSLDELLQHIVAAISSCTGFHIAVIKLIEADGEHMVAVAFAGVVEENERQLRVLHDPMQQLARIMRPEFRLSQSYFVSHEHIGELADIPLFTQTSESDYELGGWHPEDMFIIPLYSPRRRQLLGILSLDDPADGKVPSLENVEAIELFANQAAVAIDNARLFQEREAERQVLDEAIASLQSEFELIGQGDFCVRVHPAHEKLRPVGDAINAMVGEISHILGKVQMVTQAVDEHTRAVQHNSELLLSDAHQQKRLVEHISFAVGEMTSAMNQLSERTSQLSQATVEAVEVTTNGQNAADRAVSGMKDVREVAQVTTRSMKRLGESEQEINETIVAITDLTTRMNLLALNAAIEATRAGEHGHGFAVVAQEIRTLAVHSSESARKVAAHIRNIQQQTATVSQSIEANTREIVQQTEIVTQTGLALDAISVVTEQMANQMQGIAIVSDRQAQGVQLVVGDVDQISHMTSEITDHMQHMQQSLDHLVELTNSLRERLATLRLS